MSSLGIEHFPSIFGKERDKTAYLHRPPTILPNYGKHRRTLLPKTNISKVLLFENAMQEQLLEVRLKHIQKQQKAVNSKFKKIRYTFVDQQRHRSKWHDIWGQGYQRMKDKYIAEFGTKYMPVPKQETQLDPFFINARLAPPINILCFYLDGLNDRKEMLDDRKEMKEDRNEMKNDRMEIKDTKISITDKHAVTKAEFMYDHERLISGLDTTNLQYSHSIEDPRFRSLKETLVPPLMYTDGYLQLSPGYCKEKGKVKKWASVKSHTIPLPRFYTRNTARLVKSYILNTPNKEGVDGESSVV